MKSKNGKSKNGADWQKLNEFFAEAVKLEPMAQGDFMRQVSDKSLQTELAAMLKAVQSADNLNFLKKDAFSVGAEVLVKNETFSNDRIGKYKIVREIGRGGMGAVFLAEREDFRQQVALKIIKRGMDSDEIVRRFRRERQVLATLTHPNIAHLLDGGTTEDGLPFFAMEYIEGETITKYCDAHKLSIEERLTLFRKVCAAVAYAHQHLVVHRDIKPSNILIDKTGEPKLLDFGISKLLAPNAFDSEIEQTATGANPMTPEYASPEQIRGEKITTASDIYSLGILLYELLSGHRPFHLKNRPTNEVWQIISEQEPFAPSTAAAMSEEIEFENDTNRILSPETVADSRGERPDRLRRKLQGDLDNIVLMSLRKEPSRRYSSVEQFSEDLHRHLVGLPVLARPATFIYTASKFIERNRTSVTFASIALIALLAVLSVAIWQSVVARQERARAERRLTEIRKLTNNLVSGWEKGIPASQITNQVTGRIADISSEYLENLANEINDPQIFKELANAYLELGHRYAYELVNEDKAKASFQKAETISRQLIADNPNDLEAKDLLVRSLSKYDEFFGDLDRSQSLQNHLERLRLSEEIYAAEPNEKTLGNLSKATHNYGWILKLIGRRDEAVTYFRRSNELYRQRINSLEPIAKTLDERSKLSGLYSWSAMQLQEELGDLQLSLEYYRRAGQIADAVYRENPENDDAALQKTSTQFDLGRILRKTGDFQGSIQAFRDSLSVAQNDILRSRHYGYMDRKITDNLLEIADSFDLLGDDKSALKAIHESFAHRRKVDEMEINRNSLQNFAGQAYLFYAGGKLLARMNKFDEARIAFDESESAFKKVFDGGSNQIAIKHTVTNLYLTMGDFYAGLGVCKSKTAPFADLTYGYCPSEVKYPLTTDRTRLTQARNYYEKALDILTEQETKKIIYYEDRENPRIAREKVNLCDEKLNRKS